MLRLILVVEDDPMMLGALAGLFADEGYRFRCAGDGRAALDAVAGERPDVVLSDVGMPRLDGVGLVRALRALGHALPVVLISGVVDRVDLPGVPFLPKPFDLDRVLAVVAASLDGRAA